MAALLCEMRMKRGISQRQLADEAGVKPSVVSRAERGQDSKLTTWIRLFDGLGYFFEVSLTEICEEAADLLTEEHERRVQRRREGLCVGKWRFD